MPRVKPLADSERRALRSAFHAAVMEGGTPWAKSVRVMRQILGMTQEQFARTFRLTKRQVSSFEAGTANPTMATLARIGRPFGYEIGYIQSTPDPPGMIAEEQSGH